MSIRIALCLIFSVFNAFAICVASPDEPVPGGDRPVLISLTGSGVSLVSQQQSQEKTIILSDSADEAEGAAGHSVAEDPTETDSHSGGQSALGVVKNQSTDSAFNSGGYVNPQAAFASGRCDLPITRFYKSSQFSYQIWQGYSEQRTREDQCKIQTVLSPCLGGNCASGDCHGLKLHKKQWLPKHQINAACIGAATNCETTTKTLGPPVLPTAALGSSNSQR